MPMRQFTFRGGASIEVDADPFVEDAFERIYRPCAIGCPEHDSRCSLVIRVAAGAKGYQLLLDDIPCATFDSLSQIPPFLETLACQFLLYHREDALPIHSAGVLTPRGAVLLPGEKGSGKSTLSLWLAQRGFRYLGDELLWAHPGGTVEPFPKAAAIKAGSFFLFGESREFDSLTRGPLRYFAPRNAASPMEGPFPVDCILFPLFSTAAEPGCFPLQPEETLFYLAQMVFGGMARRENLFPHLLALSANPAWLFVYRDAREVEDWLRAREGE